MKPGELTDVDLARMYFTRPASLAYVKGEGPFPNPRQPHWKVTVAAWGTGILGIGGALMTLVGLAGMAIAPGEGSMPDWQFFLIVGGPLMLALAVLFGFLYRSFRKASSSEEVLSKTGVLLPAKLVSVQNKTWGTGDDSEVTYSCVSYQFQDPGGQLRTGSVNVAGLKHPPQPATPMLVIYAGETAFDAL